MLQVDKKEKHTNSIYPINIEKNIWTYEKPTKSGIMSGEDPLEPHCIVEGILWVNLFSAFHHSEYKC